VRDIRSLFLLKVVLSQRAGVEIEPLLIAQRRVVVPFLAWVEAQLDEADPAVPSEFTVLYFRLETARMVIRFIDGLLDGTLGTAPGGEAVLAGVGGSLSLR
jgi:hypothetical protein